jgi:hypothetical protein
MSVRVMTAVWSIDLPDSQKIVLLALADCANDEGQCWPSMATLAKKCSKGERTVQGVIKELVNAGHLGRDEVPGKGCKYLVHPRSVCAPQALRPAANGGAPPQALRPTPAAAADKPSKNHKKPSRVKPSASDGALTPVEIFEDWNELAEACGLAKVRKLTAARRKAIGVRLREYPDTEDWRRAFKHIRDTPFLRGENDRGWKVTFNFLLQAKSFTNLTEESYGQAN